MLKAVDLKNTLGVFFCLALLPLNIGIEAWKWKYILRPIQHQSFWNCLKIILAGKSLNVVSPFGIGDGFSRFLGLTKPNRNQIFAGLAVDRFSQLLPTLFFGVASVLFLIHERMEVPMIELKMILMIVSIVVMTVFIGIYSLRYKIKQYLTLLYSLSFKSAISTACLSFARYFIFVVQFYLIFWALDSQLPVSIIVLGIAWVFLFKTVIPNLSVLGDLVKREVSATLFFSFFVSDLSVVIMASFLVWVINIVLPALIGIMFVSDLKKSF